MSRPQLVVTVGPPGCGKSVRARGWVAESPDTRVRVNRDDARTMTHGGRRGTHEQEEQVTLLTHAGVEQLLLGGYSVVCDDTNLHPNAVAALMRIAARTGAELLIWYMTDVPLEVCIARDAGRTVPARVGEQVIRSMWQQYQDSQADVR